MSALLLCLLIVQDPEAKAAAIMDAMRVEDAGARRKAVEDLVQLGTVAVPVALKVLADESPGLPARVKDLVGKLASREWKERDEATKLLAQLGRRAIDHLKPHQDVADAEVAWRVRTALAEIEEKRARENSLDQLRTASVCEALGRIGDASCVAPLLKELKESQSADVRLRAAEALGLLRSVVSDAQAAETTEEIVSKLLISAAGDRRSRSLLVKTLGRLKSPAAVRPLGGLVREASEKDVHLKRLAMDALAGIGDPEGVAAILRGLSADDAYLRESALRVAETIAGKDHGFNPRLDAKGNAAAIVAFREWWEKKYSRAWEE